MEIVEIQQTSDITYRVFDWNRVDDSGKPREMHTALAVDAIEYGCKFDYNVSQVSRPNEAVELAKCQYFTTNIVEINGALERDFSSLDTFIIDIGLEGEVELAGEGCESIRVKGGETCLMPAESKNSVTLTGLGKLLEVYIE